MKAIRQKVNATILEDEREGLLWDDSAEPIYLRYAFVTLGQEEHILPAFLLDDWGNEIKGLGLYDWVEENGLYFPRAEIFGFKPTGQETQIFLRALDLIVKFRCYAYQTAETPIKDGRLIDTIFFIDDEVREPAAAKRPSNAPKLLSKSAVKWAKIPD